MPLSIKIDRERCMGSGNCAFHAPNTFDLDDEMKAIVVDPAGDPREQLKAVVSPARGVGRKGKSSQLGETALAPQLDEGDLERRAQGAGEGPVCWMVEQMRSRRECVWLRSRHPAPPRLAGNYLRENRFRTAWAAWRPA